MIESLRAIKLYAVRTLLNMPTRIVFCMSLLMIAVIVGCTGEKTAPQLTDEIGTLTGVLKIEPFPPAPMQDTVLQLSLTDSGQPVQGAVIEMTLTMPGCAMAPSFLEATEIGEGKYQVQTVLTMSGDWKVDATVSIQGKNENLTFFFATN